MSDTTPTRVELLTRIPSSELRQGDVVLGAYGMRILIDRPINNDGGNNVTDMVVYWSRGSVINFDDLPSDFPRSWCFHRGESADDPRWSIQGNDLAKWTVERPVS